MLPGIEETTIERGTCFVIGAPNCIPAGYKQQMLNLVDRGGQVKRERAAPGIENAALIGLTLFADQVIATCCLKTPLPDYKMQVFTKARANRHPDLYLFELGYITTHHDFEGERYCQLLLKTFFPRISHLNMFATTRKPAMRHVLEKNGFYQVGERYGEQADLELMLYDGGFG